MIFSTLSINKVAAINKFLKENYGFSLKQNLSIEDLQKARQVVEAQLYEMKQSASYTCKDPDFVKTYLILEALDTMISNPVPPALPSPATVTPPEMMSPPVVHKSKIHNGKTYSVSGTYDKVFEILSKHIENNIEMGDSIEDAVEDAIRDYRSSKFRYPEEVLRDELMQKFMDTYGGEIVSPSTNLLDSKEKNKRIKEMKENTVKELRKLIESEVENAEVIVATKGFSQELQGMIEKVGRLENEDLGPVNDQVREVYGIDAANSFQSTVYGELHSVLERIKQAKDNIDKLVIDMSSGHIPGSGGNDMAVSDMGMPSDSALDLAADDGFGATEPASGPADEPLGRSLKDESAKNLKNKITETAKKIELLKRIQETTKKIESLKKN